MLLWLESVDIHGISFLPLNIKYNNNNNILPHRKLWETVKEYLGKD